MLLAKCPKCQEPVTLPGLVDIDVQVRCPLCTEIYSFRDVLDRLPPMLEVVSAQPSRETGPTAAPTVAARAAVFAEPEFFGSEPVSEVRESEAVAASEVPIASPHVPDSAPLKPAAVESSTDGDVEFWTDDLPESSESLPTAPDDTETSVELDDLVVEKRADRFAMTDEELALESTDQPELVDEELVHQEFSPSESFAQVVSPSVGESGDESLAGLGRISASSRPRRRQRNPLVEFIKVILGGLLAIPATQLILWWLPLELQPAQRDPLSIGPTVGQYVPFVVPESVRNARVVAQASPPSNVAAQRTKAPTSDDPNLSSTPFGELPDVPGATSPGDNSGDGLDGGALDPSRPESGASSDEKVAGAGNEDAVFPIDPAEVLKPTLPPDSTLTLTPPESALAITPPVLPAAGATKEGKTETPPDGAQTPAPVSSAPTESASEKPAENHASALPSVPTAETASGEKPADVAPDPALVQAREISQRWDGATAPSRDDHRELYKALSRLGATATPLSPSAGNSLQGDASRFLAEMSLSDLKRKLIGNAASSWLANASRDSDGVAFIGSVKQVVENGPWLEATVELASADARAVTVIAPAGQTIKVGDDLLLGLGRIVAEPAKALEGYQGDARTVIVLGAFRSVGKP